MFLVMVQELTFYFSLKQIGLWEVVLLYHCISINVCCCCLPVTSRCSVNKSRGGGVSTSVSNYSEPRLCRLLLRSYYSHPPYPTLPPLDIPPRDIPPPALSANTARCAFTWYHPPTWDSPVSIPAYRYESSLHRLLRSPEPCPSPMPLPCILLSIVVFLSLLIPPP